MLARAHQGLIWTRQRQVSGLRSALRDYFPGALSAFGSDLGSADALAILAIAPTPDAGPQALAGEDRRGPCPRGPPAQPRAADGRYPAAHCASSSPRHRIWWPRPSAPPPAPAWRCSHRSTSRSPPLERELGELFDRHPDAEILRSLAGLGSVLGARVLGEFGDDPNRYADARGRKAYAGTAPITKASGRSLVVPARVARNRRLADACERWAFCSLTTSPGARCYYDQLRARGKTHSQATRQLANRWVGSSTPAWSAVRPTERRLPGLRPRKSSASRLDA